MRIDAVLRRWLAISFFLCAPLLAATGPDDRPITDPHSVMSASDAAARPAPVDDLYYTRNVLVQPGLPTDSKSYSPPIFRAVSICGRCAPQADGPSSSPNPTMSSRAQSGRQMASGLFISRTTPETSYTISTRFPPMEAIRST